MKTLSKISNNNQHAVVLCGDFNSMPSSSLYHGITTGISKNKFDTQPIQYPKPFVKTPKTYSYYPLTSCYKKIFKKEPKFTNYTDVFKETLDYIFVNDKIKVIGSLEQVDDKYIKNLNPYLIWTFHQTILCKQLKLNIIIIILFLQ